MEKLERRYAVTCNDAGPKEYGDLESAMEGAENMARDNPDEDIHILETIKACTYVPVKPPVPPVTWLKVK